LRTVTPRTKETAGMMKPIAEAYKNGISEAEPVGEFINDNVAITTSFLCLEDEQQALQLASHSGNGRQQTLVFRYLDTFPKPSFVPEWPEELPDPTVEQLIAGRASGASVVGTPEQCIEAVAQWEGVADQLIMGPSGSVYPDSLLQETVELFGRTVIPQFDKAPEHSTDVYKREAAKRLGLA